MIEFYERRHSTSQQAIQHLNSKQKHVRAEATMPSHSL